MQSPGICESAETSLVPEFPLVEELAPVPSLAEALRAFADWPDVILFDSALPRPSLGRYSFLAADPVEFVQVSRPGMGVDPFEQLTLRMKEWTTPAIPDLPPFQGGAAGLLSYELGGSWERIAPARVNEFEFPALAVGLYDWVLAWDHLQSRAWIISQGLPELDPDRRRRRAAERLAAVRQQLTNPSTRDSTKLTRSQRDRTIPLPENRHAIPGAPHLTSNFSRDGYLSAVARAIEYIRAGDIFQVNLSQRLALPCSRNPVEYYLDLRRCNPAPFAGFFAHDDWAVASSSPERFVSLKRQAVETRPIKGTRQRRGAPEADLYTRDELRESEKDQAENVMIVDLLRNDLSRVCEAGSIRVPDLCRVESYETVQHLVSVVQGRLRSGLTAFDLFTAAFPGGSITGAPKVRAMEIIAELEPTVRGPYCGSLFYVGCDGTLDSSILIRTVCLRRGWGVFPVGGGVVAQSDPADEYDETLHKATGMLRTFT